MKKIFTFVLIFIIFLPSLVFAQEQKKKALYFYSESCSLCEEVDDYFNFAGFYEKYSLEKIEVSGPYNMSFLNEFFDVFGVKKEKRGWPAIVFGNEMLIGSQPIIEKFSREMEESGTTERPVPAEIKKNFEQKRQVAADGMENKKISFLMVSGLGFIDSVSPCSLAVVVVLLSILLFLRRERKVFSIGIYFTAGIFMAYFLLGFVSIDFSGKILLFSKPISISMGILAIFIGFFDTRYIINPQKLPLGKYFSALERGVDFIFKKISNPAGIFLLGFVSNLFLVPCATRPYFSTMRTLFSGPGSAKDIFFLLSYNFIFILPLIFVMLVVYFGVRSKKIRTWRNKKSLLARTKLIHVIIGSVMIFAGLYLIQNWI